MSIEHFICEILYYIDIFFCKALSILYRFFNVFAGITEVKNGDETKTLIEVFFFDTSAGRIYSYMAIIGIAISFAFTIYAVIKKIFDIDDKIKNSLGGIIGNQLKCILFILLMNFVMQLVITSTNTFMERIVFVFNNSEQPVLDRTIDFTSDQYATMGRIMNTVGNYSLNPSYDSRYNINSCYNEIKDDLQLLYEQGVFKYSYDEDTVSQTSWQYFITKIGNAHDVYKEQNIDEYNDGIAVAIKDCMAQLKTNKSFTPISSYTTNVKIIEADDTPFDALVFLSATTDAAWNRQYNEKPDIYDSLRYDYVRKGGKSIYDFYQVEQDFNIKFAAFDHLAIIFMGFVLCRVFLNLCMNCVARVFNLMLLYLTAPFFIASTPLDDGEKTKQWSIAFIVQAFGVFGSIFGIRILMLFVPVIFNGGFVLFESGTLNFLAKVVMIFALSCAIEQASKIVTGILANNAGFQSIQAADVGSQASGRLMGTARSIAGAAKTVASHSVLGTAYNAVASKAANSNLGYLFGVGKGSRAAFDRQNEAAGKPNHEESMAKSAESMSKAAESFAESMKKFNGGGADSQGGDSKNEANNEGGRKRGGSMHAPSNRMSLGGNGGSGGTGGPGAQANRPRHNSLPNSLQNHGNMK